MTILITGGCGSIGSALVKNLTQAEGYSGHKQLRIFDNNEYALYKMKEEYKNNPCVKFLYGDVRDKERLVLAMNDVGIVYHTAAMKHVHICEANPDEAFKTNVVGTMNVRDAAWKNNVEKVVNISTDKAVNPINVLGATKLLAEKLITSAKQYKDNTIFANVRFGNVFGSNGSVIEMFKNDTIEITDMAMTRFVMTINDAVRLIIKVASTMKGGETFILKMPAFKLSTFVDAFKKPHQKIKIVGKRPGERQYESLVSYSEMPYCEDIGHCYIIYDERVQNPAYVLDSNSAEWLTKEQLKKMACQ